MGSKLVQLYWTELLFRKYSEGLEAILTDISWSFPSPQMDTSYLKISHDQNGAISYLLTNTEALIDAGKEVGINVNNRGN